MKIWPTILLAAMLSGIAAPYPQTMDKELPELEIDFTWSQESLRKGISPFIMFSSIPPGTIFLRITFTNLQAPGMRQRGSIIRYTGKNSLEEGSVEDLSLPPLLNNKPGLTEYRLTVTALSENRTALAVGSCTRTIAGRTSYRNHTLTSDEIIVR